MAASGRYSDHYEPVEADDMKRECPHTCSHLFSPYPTSDGKVSNGRCMRFEIELETDMDPEVVKRQDVFDTTWKCYRSAYCLDQ